MLYTVKSDTMKNADGMQSWAIEYDTMDVNIVEAVTAAINAVHPEHEVVECEAEDVESAMGYDKIVTARAYKVSDYVWELHFHNINGTNMCDFEIFVALM